jgi:hypothetical protein
MDPTYTAVYQETTYKGSAKIIEVIPSNTGSTKGATEGGKRNKKNPKKAKA